MKVDNTIRVERARHRISQGDLALKVGTSRQSIHAIETGKFIPGAKIAIKLATFFKIKVEELFTLKED